MADPKLKFILEVDDKGTPTVKEFARSVDRAGTAAEQAGGKFGRMGTSIGDVAKRSAAAAGKLAALGAAGAAAFAGWGVVKAVKEFSSFETELTKLSNLGVTGLKEIGDQIRALPPELGSATELVAGYYQVLSSGITEAGAAMDTLITSAKLAKAAHLDQATSVQAVTAGMKAFDTSAENVANSLLKIEQTGVTTVANLATYFGEIANLASAVGIGLEETGAALAAVTQTAGTTEKATTQLRAIMQELISPTTAMNNLFSDLGGTMGAIEQIGLEGVIRRIAEATGGNAEKVNELVGSQEALRGVLALVTGDMKFFNEALEAQKNSAGSLEASWAAFQETLGAIWETFKNSVGRIAIDLGEKLAPKIKEVVGEFGKWLEVNRQAISEKVFGWIDTLSGGLDDISFDDLIRTGGQAITAIENLAGAVADLVGFLRDAAAAIDRFQEKFNLISRAAKAATATATGDWNSFVDAMKDGADKAADAVESSMDKIENEVRIDFEPVKIEADTEPAERSVDDFLSMVEGKVAESQVEANTAAAESSVETLVYEINGKKATITVDADTSNAEAKAKALQEQLDEWSKTVSESSKAKLDADPEPAKQAMDEVKNKADQTKNEIERDPVDAYINNDPAVQSLEDLEGHHKSTKRTIELNVISVPLDTSPAEVALESLREKARGTIAGIMEQMAVAMANAENIGLHTTYRTEKRFRNMLEGQKNFWNTATGYAETMVNSAPFGLDTGWQGGYGSGGAGGGDEGPKPLGSYALGTGLSGVPQAGLYKLHQGEIVVPPDQSSQIRSIARAAGLHSSADMAALFSADGASGPRGSLMSGGAGISGGSLAGGGAGVSGGSLGYGGSGARSGGMQRVYNNSVTVAPTFMSGDAAAARHVAAEIQRALDEQNLRRR